MKPLRKAIDFLSFVKSYPSYVGRTIRPDTPFWARAYYNFCSAINRRDYQVRKDLVPSVVSQSPRPVYIDRDIGYKVCDFSDIDIVKSCVRHCLEVTDREKVREKTDVAQKSFLVTHHLDILNPEHASILDLATSPLVVGPIAEYLGAIPVLSSAAIWYSPNKFFDKTRSQAYHLDGEDLKQMKCFIMLDDVTVNSGPMTILPAKESCEIFKNLQKRGQTKYRNQKHEDDVIYDNSSLKEGIPLVGGKGGAAFVDTSSCYHYGSRPGKNSTPRLLLHLHYYSAFSIEMPLWGRKYKSVAPVVENDPSQKSAMLRRLLLGLSHLDFPRVRRSSTAAANY